MVEKMLNAEEISFDIQLDDPLSSLERRAMRTA
jgi:hypothetical protein